MLGNHRLHLEITDSTQYYLEELLSNSRPANGTVITADYQHKGMGQSGRGWHSSAGKNLLMSAFFAPSDFEVKDIWLINEAIAIATRKCIKTFLPQQAVKIKWPNDIYIEDKKVAGILLKSKIVKKRIEHLIIGIGINVNEVDFPAVLPNPISLAEASNNWYSIETIYEELMLQLNAYLAHISAGQAANLQEEYHTNLYCLGVEKSFFTPERGKFAGVIKGVTKEGILQIECEDGLATFRQNEVSYLMSK